MAANQTYASVHNLPVTATHPTTPLSGQPLRVGEVTGVAVVDERSDGTITADMGPAVYTLSVKGVNDNGNTAVAVGDALFYVDSDIGSGTGFLSEKASGRFFGWALETVGSGSTATIQVLLLPARGAQVSAGSLSGAQAALVADGNVIGGIPVVHRVLIAAGALADTDIVLTYKTRVIDAYLVLLGAGVASTTLTVKNGASAITNAMAASGADNAIVRATTLDDANWEIAAGGTLRVTSAVGASQPDAAVFVTGLRVA